MRILWRDGHVAECLSNVNSTFNFRTRPEGDEDWRTEQAYDQHLNMILGEVEETITTVEYDEDTYEEHVKVRIPSFQDCQLAVPRPQWLLARAVLPPCGSEPSDECLSNIVHFIVIRDVLVAATNLIICYCR